VRLEYWAWGTGISETVAVWNEKRQDIQVDVVPAAGPADMLPKLLAAVRAGQGPDIAQAEYHKLPNLMVSDIAMDISGYRSLFAKHYSDAALNLVTMDGRTYGVPQDYAPVIYMYRQDLFRKHKLDVPESWGDFAELARKVPELDPRAKIAGIPSDASMAAAYIQPLGTQWWNTDGDSWTVGIDGPGARTMAEVWDPIVADGLIDDTAMWTPEWGNKLNGDRLYSWTVGAWGPGSAQPVAARTAGKWAVAPMPKWGQETGVGIMGGSSVMLTRDAKNVEAAVEFLTWLNASAEGTGTMVAKGGLFPASQPGLDTLADQPIPELVSGQRDFWDVAVEAANKVAPVTWGPNVQVGFTTWEDQVKRVISGSATFLDASAATQKAVVDDLKDSGFAVSA
jgi:multiple sugar transport system substrate-binding protein